MTRCTQAIVNRTGWHSHQCKKEGVLFYENYAYCDEHYPPHADMVKESRNAKLDKAKSRMEETANLIALLRTENKELRKALDKLEKEMKHE